MDLEKSNNPESTLLIRLKTEQYFSLPEDIRLFLSPHVIKVDPGDFEENIRDDGFAELHKLKREITDKYNAYEYKLRELRRKQLKNKKDD